MSLLSIRNLSVAYAGENGLQPTVDGVSLTIERGETLCLVGESGCGKSTLAMAVPRLLPAPPATVQGEILFDGKSLLSLPIREMQKIRGRHIGVVFQDPMSALSPLMRIGRQMEELFLLHTTLSAKERQAQSIVWLERVGLPHPEALLAAWPHELSGGMKQRVMIAMALALHPELLIADEPTTALDVVIQNQILQLLRTLCREEQTALWLITHDMGVVSQMADRVMVMYAGEIVESAQSTDFFQSPQHPYSRALLRAIPSLSTKGRPLYSIPGSVPPPGEWGTGCRFAKRCDQVQ
ncbi:MAG: ABC transporter ATP-binding protein, partial [Kiritimatiellia bacterium]